MTRPLMTTDDFDFELPRVAIAQHPVRPRDAARLLVVGETLEDRGVAELPGLLRPGDVLVVNDTRVIPARLFGRRGTAKVEVTLVASDSAGPGDDASGVASGGARWRAFARPAKRLKPGDRIEFGAGLAARVTDQGARGEVGLAFELGGAAFAAALDRAGAMPLPPYIKRAAL